MTVHDLPVRPGERVNLKKPDLLFSLDRVSVLSRGRSRSLP